MKNILSNEESMRKVQTRASEFFSKFTQQRSSWEDIWKVADYMVKCAQNRAMYETEKTKGQNPTYSDGERAQTGSTLFFKLHRQLASQLASVALSGDRPFSYSPVVNTEVFGSEEESRAACSQANALARWTMKMDRFKVKFINFCHQLKKYGNVPVMFYQNYLEGEADVFEPKFETTVDGEGRLVQKQTGTKVSRKKVVKQNWPTFKVLPIDSVYADVLIGDLQRQECVIVVSAEPKSEIISRAVSGEYDREQCDKITSSHKWDGSSYATMKQERLTNQDVESPMTATDQYLVFDIFIRVPMDGEEYDETGETDPQIYWLTVVGSDPKTGIPVRFERNPDPDDEIPIFMMHSLPDDEDVLYHVCEAQVIRSNYSVECTIKNQMIDNNSEVNHPPLIEVDSAVRGTDRQFKPNARWIADSIDSIKDFPVRDLSQHNMALLEYIRTDQKEALSATSNILGEAYGGRTTAMEASNAYKNAVQPHMVTIEYNLDAFLTVYARKMLSLWRKYAKPGQVVAISDEFEIRQVNPKNLIGEFDIEINAVEQYEDDVVTVQQMYELLQISASNPLIAKSVDFTEFMIEILRRRKGVPYTRIIHKPYEYDSRSAARTENNAMMSGTQVKTNDGENNDVHLQVHMAERLRYKGLEDSYPYVQFLDQHIDEHKLKLQGDERTNGQPTAEQKPPTGGEGAIEAQLGGMMGGMSAGSQMPTGPVEQE
jgi:hypothetical protein